MDCMYVDSPSDNGFDSGKELLMLSSVFCSGAFPSRPAPLNPRQKTLLRFEWFVEISLQCVDKDVTTTCLIMTKTEKCF